MEIRELLPKNIKADLQHLGLFQEEAPPQFGWAYFIINLKTPETWEESQEFNNTLNILGTKKWEFCESFPSDTNVRIYIFKQPQELIPQEKPHE